MEFIFMVFLFFKYFLNTFSYVFLIFFYVFNLEFTPIQQSHRFATTVK